MVVKSRLSVLVGTGENVNEYTSNNGTHVVVQGAENVALQQKWVLRVAASPAVSAGESSRSGVRSTWACGRSGGRRAFWDPFFIDGFNVYYIGDAVGPELAGGIETPRYRYVRGKVFEKPASIAGLDLDPARCDIEILEEQDETVVTQWCALGPGEKVAFTKESGVEKAEAGVFYVDFLDGEDVGLSGLTCNWGGAGDDGSAEIEKCRETMLVYKPAHMGADQSRVARLEHPLGLHPKILVDLSDFSSKEQCEYFLYAALPRDLFVDKFQSSPLFVFGERDLEQPEYMVTDAWGSEAMFRLEPGRLNEITLHSRYVEPVEGGGFKEVAFKPLVFQACDTGNDNVAKNPFYAKGLGYEEYFTRDTVFHHIDSPQLHVQIPRADVNDFGPTQWITFLCIGFSVIYLLFKLLRGTVKRRNPKSNLH